MVPLRLIKDDSMLKKIIQWSIFILLMVCISLLFHFQFPYYITVFLYCAVAGYGVYLFLFKNHYYPWNMIGGILTTIGFFFIALIDNIIVTLLVICLILLYEIKTPH